MRARWLLLAALTGCNLILGIEDTSVGGDGGESDGSSPPDGAMADAGDGGPGPVDAGPDGPLLDAGPPGSIVRVTAGGDHTCAQDALGRVRCWGRGDSGQLGYGNNFTIGDNEAPSLAGDVSTGGTVIGFSAGGAHTCAVTVGGQARCWGSGSNGRLGTIDTSDIGDTELPSSLGPIDLGGVGTVQIAAGGSHTCALTDGASVYCWGHGGSGQLGYAAVNDVGDNEAPHTLGTVQVGANNVAAVVAGEQHTCALTGSGSVICWGHGTLGRLGYANQNNIGDNETPDTAGLVQVGETAIQIVAGAAHTCVLTNAGSVRCWGSGADGRLGYANSNNVGDNEAPDTVGTVDVGGAVIRLAAGESHTCALLNNGAVRCWGAGMYGVLGYGNETNIGDNETPASAGDVSIGGLAIDLVAGARHTCAILDTFALRCWGYNVYGQLGYATTNAIGDTETPASAGDVPVF